MIQRQLKLKLTKRQERELERWLWHLASVWNWAIRKIELDASDRIYYSQKTFQNLLTGHGQKLDIPSHVLQGVLVTAYTSWQRCFKRIARKPRFKSKRNKLNNIIFPDPLRPPKGNRVTVLGLGSLRFARQSMPEGRIKRSQIVKRASGWYLCLFIDAQPNAVQPVGDGAVGIDPACWQWVTPESTSGRVNAKQWTGGGKDEPNQTNA